MKRSVAGLLRWRRRFHRPARGPQAVIQHSNQALSAHRNPYSARANAPVARTIKSESDPHIGPSIGRHFLLTKLGYPQNQPQVLNKVSRLFRSTVLRSILRESENQGTGAGDVVRPYDSHGPLRGDSSGQSISEPFGGIMALG